MRLVIHLTVDGVQRVQILTSSLQEQERALCLYQELAQDIEMLGLRTQAVALKNGFPSEDREGNPMEGKRWEVNGK